MLSAVAEKNIQFMGFNMQGLFNVLDLTKKYINKIFWPSSIAVLTSPKLNTPQTTILEPSTVYGISKMAGERCEYYFKI